MSRADEFQGSLTILRPVQITSQWVEKSSKRVLFGSTGFYCVLISFSSGEKRERDSVVTQRATSLFPTESSVGERTLFGRNDERERPLPRTNRLASESIRAAAPSRVAAPPPALFALVSGVSLFFFFFLCSLPFLFLFLPPLPCFFCLLSFFFSLSLFSILGFPASRPAKSHPVVKNDRARQMLQPNKDWFFFLTFFYCVSPSSYL